MFDVAAFKMTTREMNGTVSSSGNSTDCDISKEEKDQFPMNDYSSMSGIREGGEYPPLPPLFSPALFHGVSLGDYTKNIFTSPNVSHKSFTSPSWLYKNLCQLNLPGSFIGNLDDNSMSHVSLVLKEKFSKQGIWFADTANKKDISRLHYILIHGFQGRLWTRPK
jgi:hypothetical protein